MRLPFMVSDISDKPKNSISTDKPTAKIKPVAVLAAKPVPIIRPSIAASINVVEISPMLVPVLPDACA